MAKSNFTQPSPGGRIPLPNPANTIISPDADVIVVHLAGRRRRTYNQKKYVPSWAWLLEYGDWPGPPITCKLGGRMDDPTSGPWEGLNDCLCFLTQIRLRPQLGILIEAPAEVVHLASLPCDYSEIEQSPPGTIDVRQLIAALEAAGCTVTLVTLPAKLNKAHSLLAN